MKAGLLVRYVSALIKYNLLKAWSDQRATKGLVSAVLEYDFGRGTGRRLESVSIHSVFPEISESSWKMVGKHWCQEVPYLCGALMAIGARTILEIGTFHGCMTLQMAANLPDDGRVYTVDIDPTEAANLTPDYSDFDRGLAEKDRQLLGHLYRGSPHASKIVQILQDSSTVDYSKYFDSCDLAYIDGGHSYEQVKKDTEKVLKLVRKGGAIFWHDYQPGCSGVTSYLHELGKQLPIKHVFQTQLVVLRLS